MIGIRTMVIKTKKAILTLVGMVGKKLKILMP
jgi:hypothetical protein